MPSGVSTVRGAASAATVMPVGAVALLSFVLAGLGSVLLRGRTRLGLMLLMNGAILAAAGLIAATRGLFFDDEDYAGWLWMAVWVLVDALGVRYALHDRRELIVGASPQAAP